MDMEKSYLIALVVDFCLIMGIILTYDYDLELCFILLCATAICTIVAVGIKEDIKKEEEKQG